MLVKHLLFINGQMMGPNDYKLDGEKRDRKPDDLSKAIITTMGLPLEDTDDIWLVTPRLLSGSAGGTWFEITYFKVTSDKTAEPMETK